MAQDGRLVAHLHRIPALVDLIDEDWRHEHLSHDDFDLPSVDFDEESDDVRTQPQNLEAHSTLIIRSCPRLRRLN